MDNTRLEVIKNTIHELSKTQKSITVDQIIEASGIQDPHEEIEFLKRCGIIMRLEPDDIRWV